MFSSRCPYCGEKLSPAKSFFSKMLTKFSFTCPHCHQKYRLQYPKILLVSIPFGIYALLYYNTDIQKNTFLNIFIIILAVLMIGLIVSFIPLEKYKMGDIITSYEADNRVKCIIEWTKDHHFVKHLHFYSGCILPVCFFGKDNIPISHVWCVVFHKVHHYWKTSTCTIEFVLNEAPSELFQVGNRFSIFLNKKTIGTGIIKKVD